MKLALILAIMWLNEATPKEMRTRDKAKIKASKPRNICNLEPSDNNNIRCFCTKEKYQTVTSAECWIFGQVARDHFIWTLIVESQPYLADFHVIASNQGQLKSIPQDFLQKMAYLKNFTVSFGMMDRLGKYAFGNSSSLENLKLAKNQIEYLEPFAIAYLPSLIEIDLEENRLRTVGTSVFHYVPQLKYVRFNNNNITKVEDEAFVAMGNVLEMDLSENYICDINTLTFFGLSKLKVIDLSVNRIISLASSVFSEMWDVEEVYLDENFIEFISNRAFDGLRFLKTISLKSNRLTRFPAGLLTSVFTLVNLDVSNNRLETLLFDSIEQFYNNLIHNGTIQLKGNRFSCDCRLDWVYSLYHKTTQPHIRNSLEEFQCTVYADVVAVTTEVKEYPVCPNPERSNAIDPEFDAKDYPAEGDDDEDDDTGKIYLMSRPVESLPCPPEYRPTPITVKQGAPVITSIFAGGATSRSATSTGAAGVLVVFVLCFM